MTVGGEGPTAAAPVFIDVDTGVDDAMALVYLFASKEAELVGIASTAGNVPVQQVCRNNLGLLELCQITDVPVSKGSERPVSTPLRTAEDTIRSLAGVRIGDTLEEDTLETVRERLNTVGLFADVNVWWENKGEGVRRLIEEHGLKSVIYLGDDVSDTDAFRF